MRKISKDEILAALGRIPDDLSDASSVADKSEVASTVDLEEYSIVDVEDNPDIVEVIKIELTHNDTLPQKEVEVVREDALPQKEVEVVRNDALPQKEDEVVHNGALPQEEVEADDVVEVVNGDHDVMIEDIIDDISECDLVEEMSEGYEMEEFSEDDDEFTDTRSNFSEPRPCTSSSSQTYERSQQNVLTQTAPKQDAEIQTDDLPVRKRSKFSRFLRKCMKSALQYLLFHFNYFYFFCR